MKIKGKIKPTKEYMKQMVVQSWLLTYQYEEYKTKKPHLSWVKPLKRIDFKKNVILQSELQTLNEIATSHPTRSVA